jgi:hypothetical protein
MNNVGHALTAIPLALSAESRMKKGRRKVYTGKPIYVRADPELRDAVDRLVKYSDEPAGVADVVRAAILKAAARLPAGKRK